MGIKKIVSWTWFAHSLLDNYSLHIFVGRINTIIYYKFPHFKLYKISIDNTLILEFEILILMIYTSQQAFELKSILALYKYAPWFEKNVLQYLYNIQHLLLKLIFLY